MSEDNNNANHNHGNITPLLIQDEMKSCYLDYAMSVIVGRALHRRHQDWHERLGL